jgi:hypothetical protein
VADDQALFVSQAEFARRRGVSRKTVTVWKDQGKLVLDADGKVDVAATEALLGQRPETYRGGVTSQAPGALQGNAPLCPASDAAATPPAQVAPTSRPKQPGEGTPPIDLSPEGLADANGWTLADATRVKEIFLALKRKRDFDVATGQLVDIEEVALQVEAEYAIVRERLMTIPGKLAARLVGLDRAAIEEALLEEISEALSELHEPGAGADRSLSAGEPAPASPVNP